jgi:ankyrin repeat protein
MFKLSIRGGQ